MSLPGGRLLLPAVLLVGTAVVGVGACETPRDAVRARPLPDGDTLDVSAFFEEMEATFVLLDLASGEVRRHDPERARSRFPPASTFKIPNTLIALETGVASGPDTRIRWDSTRAPRADHWPESWARDQTLRSAFRNSVVWAYEELARRVGRPRYRNYLERLDYGNRDVSGGVDAFWLRGGLRISPDEQVDFLRRFRARQLGVSERSTAIVEELMRLEEGPGYRLLGKTGTWEVTPTREGGWLVGFVETERGDHAFALNIEGEEVWERWPPQRRTVLVRRILEEIGVL